MSLHLSEHYFTHHRTIINNFAKMASLHVTWPPFSFFSPLLFRSFFFFLIPQFTLNKANSFLDFKSRDTPTIVIQSKTSYIIIPINSIHKSVLRYNFAEALGNLNLVPCKWKSKTKKKKKKLVHKNILINIWITYNNSKFW